MTVLQTIALPLGYSAIRMARGRLITGSGPRCQPLDFPCLVRVLQLGELKDFLTTEFTIYADER